MRGIRGKATALGPSAEDKYATRLLKYIPAEVVALFVSANGVVPTDLPDRSTYQWIIFAFCVVATPVYLFFTARDEVKKKPIWTQILLATIAFPVWAFALGGVFASLSWYQPFAGSLLLMGVTFIFGIVKV